MALQGPFFGKKESDHTPPARSPATPSSLGGRSTLGGGSGLGQSLGASTQSPATAPAGSAAATLTVGPNIKLKGVEITDCDTLLVEGTVEATMKSRVIQIADKGTFKGSVEVDIAEVHGSFDGDLTARQKLTIFANGQVEGKIRYGKVVIEEGGRLSGEVSFDTTPRGSTPAAKTGA